MYHAHNLALKRRTDARFKWQDICDKAAEKIKQFEECKQELHNDHSSGHNKNRPDGLNENLMNKFYGGNKAKMRSTKIENKSYLGNFVHPNKLKVGEVQSMIFMDNDIGPFYLLPQERVKKIRP